MGNTAFVGTGSVKREMYAVNLNTGEKRQIAVPAEVADRTGFTYEMDADHRYVYVLFSPGGGWVYDTWRDRWAGSLGSRNLTKTYYSTEPPTQVINGIDLTVRKGEFLVVMGASGSGKSSLVYSISGMDRPTSGTVLLEGRDLTSLSDAEMSRVRLTKMGFVFQQAYFLSNLNIGDNILLPALKAAPKAKDAATARVDALMERFGIAHVKQHGITQVSGGQLQRASICRALACEPSVLFADEPTGALNNSMSAEVMDALTEVHGGRDDPGHGDARSRLRRTSGSRDLPPGWGARRFPRIGDMGRGDIGTAGG